VVQLYRSLGTKLPDVGEQRELNTLVFERNSHKGATTRRSFVRRFSFKSLVAITTTSGNMDKMRGYPAAMVFNISRSQTAHTARQATTP
jgi:hypothetical protein